VNTYSTRSLRAISRVAIVVTVAAIAAPTASAFGSRRHPPRAAAATGTAASLPKPAAWVRRLQADLTKLGFFSGPVTGVYGPLTTAAVKRFQAAARVSVDGRWGPQSQAALVRMLKRHR